MYIDMVNLNVDMKHYYLNCLSLQRATITSKLPSTVNMMMVTRTIDSIILKVCLDMTGSTAL